MTKNEFMYQLAEQLLPLPAEERVAALKYYDEYFEEAGPENVDRVIAELGSPSEVAKGILADYAQNNPGWRPRGDTKGAGNVPPGEERAYAAAAPVTGSKVSKGWIWVIALLLTSPIWFPVVVAVLGVVFGVITAAVVILFALALVAACICIAGVIVGFCSIGVLFVTPPVGLLGLGTGLVLTGLGLLGVIGMLWITGKVVPPVVRWFVDLCRKPFYGAQRRQGV